MEKEELVIEEAAKRFVVGTASISRWKQNPDPTFTRNRPAQKINMDALKQDVQTNSYSYIYERAARFTVSQSGMRDALRWLGFSRQKTLQLTPFNFDNKKLSP